MRRIWLPSEHWTENQFWLSDEPFRHACQVLKFRIGDEFECVCGEPTGLVVRIVEIEKKRALVQVVSKTTLPVPTGPEVILVAALPKSPTFDAVVEKCVEIGIYKIIPVFTEHSFFKSAKDIGPNKIARWHKIVESGTEQSRRGSLMQVAEPTEINKVIAGIDLNAGDVGLFAYEGDGDLPIKSALQGLKSKSPTRIFVFVGSEGGFSDTEVKLFRQKGFPPVTAGPLVLRVETACVAILSVIKYEFDEMKR